ncbi:protein ROS1A-like [Cornus florida]|uniref:protein ROS1A-like n=1 Tax=Cornus florida TaxID=4283 RepID=UPI00289DF15E|nr:protein ROS1A-like [Cornus florida]
MNFGRGFPIPPENDIQIRGSWMPVTPDKPILQRSNSIPVERQGNRVERGDWQELVGMYEGVLQEKTNYNEGVPNFKSIEQMGANGNYCNRVAAPASERGSFNHNVGSYTQNFRNDSAAWNNDPSAELLATNNIASVASTNRSPNSSVHVANGPSFWNSCSQVDSNWTESSSTSSLRTNQVQACGPNQWTSTESNSLMQLLMGEGFDVPCQRNYNLNSPPRSEADAASSVTNSFQFAPETPDQVKQFESYRLSERLNFSVDESSSQEKDKQENIFTSIGSEAIENHSDNLLQIIVDSSSAAISTPLKEKNSSDQGGDQGIDLNETPQQKAPKRRKHRPKVVVEGKPKRTPKMTTPRNNNSKENPSGKRKYVRKNGPNAPATQLPDVTNEVTVPNVGSEGKSCRRALNFDEENGTRDEGQEKGTSHQAEMQQVNNNSKENPSGKRKYVRKNGPKVPATQLPDVTNEVTVPNVGSEGKSCRRALNFDEEIGTRDEGQEKATSHQAEMQQVNNNSKENPSGKRKYVRKNSLKAPATQSPDVTTEMTVPNVLSEGKSCKKVSNFEVQETSHQAGMQQENRAAFDLNLDSQATDLMNSRSQTKLTMQMQQQNGYVMENQQAGIACNLNHSMNQMPAGSISLQASCAPAAPSAATPEHALNVLARSLSMKNFTVYQNGGKNGYSQVHHIHGKELSEGVIQANTTCKDLERNRQLMWRNSPQMAALDVANADEKRGSKREYCHTAEQTHSYTKILTGFPLFCKEPYLIDNNNSNGSNFGTGFPETNKKKRSENGYHATRSSTPCITAVEDCSRQVAASRNGTCTNSLTSKNSRILDSYIEKTKTTKKLNNWVNGTACDWYTSSMTAEDNFQKQLSSELHSHTEGTAEKRSYSSTRDHDLTSQTAVTNWNLLSSNPSKKAPASDHMRVSGALHANMSAKKHVVGATSSKLESSTAHELLLQENKDCFHGNCQFTMTTRGPQEKRKYRLITIDEIIYQLEGLCINGRSNILVGQEQKALVPYKSDGTIVPYEGLDPIKKRKPRPKVDLDPETNRIWKLLMGKEGSEGVEAENKEKWWEEEREVFRGRADSFIARMHLVQGDRRFSQWKGSVVDSVIGVFLTQNVSDHLSSSAFMSLAAKFPPQVTTTNETSYESGTSILADVAKGGMRDTRGTISYPEKIAGQPYHNQSSVTSCESSQYRTDNLTTGTSLANELNGRAEFISSQHSFVSLLQANREIRFNLGSNSEVEDQTTGFKSSNARGSTPVNPLHIKNSARFEHYYSDGVGSSFLNGSSKQWNEQSGDTEYNKQIPRLYKVNDLRGSSVFTHPTKSGIPNMKGPFVPSSNFQLHMMPDSRVFDVDYFRVLDEQGTSSFPSTASGIIKAKGGDYMSKRIGHMAESTYTVQQNGEPRIQAAATAAFQNKYPMHQERYSEQAPHTAINTQQQERFRDFQLESTSVKEPIKPAEALSEKQTGIRQQVSDPRFTAQTFGLEERMSIANKQKHLENKAVEADTREQVDSSSEAFSGTSTNISNMKKGKAEGDKRKLFDWDSLRKDVQPNGRRKERSKDSMDSLDYEAVRRADVSEISNAIKERGMNNMLAERIKDFLDRLVSEHGSIDLEWLRDVPPDKAKDFLLSIRGLGLKSVECVRLLTLHHLAFPVDTNVGRIAVRLGWVPLQPLPESLQLHLLELYPVLESIQKYLWPRLCKLDQRTLYELHYQMITFGKVFCTKNKPNCNACPMRGECRHFASAFASARLALPGPEEKNIVSSNIPMPAEKYPAVTVKPMPLPPAENNASKAAGFITNKCEPIVEEPTTPEPESREVSESDIEDAFYEDPDEIPTIRLNLEEFTLNLHNYMQENNMELQEGDMSKALVALNPEAASIPTPKLKNVSRLRTEHQVYELPDSHPLLKGVDSREPDDPSPYLLAIWTPGETADSTQPPERCGSQESGNLCNEETCFSCNSIRETNSQTVRGTILIPCRTAMRGSFPLNGTYFQVNEVFADHESSLNPINVPRSWIWNLPRRMVYFGTSVSTIFKGLSTEGIQYCFWRGFVCVRGFDQKSRAPRPLMARLHFPASKLAKARNEGKK